MTVETYKRIQNLRNVTNESKKEVNGNYFINY